MITVTFTSAMTKARACAFTDAADRWNRILVTAFDPVMVEGQRITGVQIDASIAPIDEAGGTLGRAGPTHLRAGSELPAKGVMEFDLRDIERLEDEGSFADVILHEMAHVLGFGTLWSRRGLVRASGTANPQFAGSNAAREYDELVGGQGPGAVPIANTGGPGTREGHWRELVFGDELLTGFLSGADRPISRLSIASFEDLGYEVDCGEADAYALPTFRELAEMGITEAVRICDLCRMGRPEPVVVDAPA